MSFTLILCFLLLLALAGAVGLLVLSIHRQLPRRGRHRQ